MTKTRLRGYTIIELLVVVTLISILTVSIIGLFLSMVRGGGRAQSLALVKEEGDYVVSTLERILRYGQSGCEQGGGEREITFVYL